MTPELAIQVLRLMSMTFSTCSRAWSRLSYRNGLVDSAARTFSLTFHTPTGMMYPGWASLIMTAPAVLFSLMSSSFTAMRDA